MGFFMCSCAALGSACTPNNKPHLETAAVGGPRAWWVNRRAADGVGAVQHAPVKKCRGSSIAEHLNQQEFCSR
jgi:hypothetical protein